MRSFRVSHFIERSVPPSAPPTFYNPVFPETTPALRALTMAAHFVADLLPCPFASAGFVFFLKAVGERKSPHEATSPATSPPQHYAAELMQLRVLCRLTDF